MDHASSRPDIEITSAYRIIPGQGVLGNMTERSLIFKSSYFHLSIIIMVANRRGDTPLGD
jgi:hypothetical protein